MPILEIKRIDSAGLLRTIGITANGKEVGRVASNESAELWLEPGDYRIRAHQDWCSSPDLLLRLDDDSRVRLETGLLNSALWRMFTAPGKALYLRQAD